MALSLPHNITNGPAPDADEVMANFNALLNHAQGTFYVGRTSGSNGTARTTVGTNTNVLPGSSMTFSVAVPSVLFMSYSGHIEFGMTSPGRVSGSLGPIIDGSGVFVVSHFRDEMHHFAQNDEIGRGVPLSGTMLHGLAAGSHTVALQYTQTVSIGSLGTLVHGVQGKGGYWGGLVIPIS